MATAAEAFGVDYWRELKMTEDRPGPGYTAQLHGELNTKSITATYGMKPPAPTMKPTLEPSRKLEVKQQPKPNTGPKLQLTA